MSNKEHSSLDGKVALITGAARRIGAEIVKTLHAAGANVAIHYRSSATEAHALRDTLNDVRANSAVGIEADLHDDDAPAALVKSAYAAWGRLDVLVNNASSFYPTPLGEITESTWLDLIGSNLKAPLFLTQAAIPSLRETSGCIINIVDIHANRPLRDHHVYGAAKAGLTMLTRSLAKDLAPQIRVNGVAPGAIVWPERGMPDDIRQNIIEQIPLGSAGSPADVAGAVLYFVRDATYVTGQILAIDGGRSIGW